MSCQMMMSLGVYALGAADARERWRVEAHLPGCPACRAELTRLAPLYSLLARVPEDMLAAGQPPGPETGHPAPGRRMRQRSGRPWWTAAVAPPRAAVVGAVGRSCLVPGGGGDVLGRGEPARGGGASGQGGVAGDRPIALRRDRGRRRLGCLARRSDQRPGQRRLAAIRHRKPPGGHPGQRPRDDQRGPEIRTCEPSARAGANPVTRANGWAGERTPPETSPARVSLRRVAVRRWTPLT